MSNAICKAISHESAHNDDQKTTTKSRRMLALFAEGGSFNRVTAENFGDHCLAFTVFSINRDYGLTFTTKTFDYDGRFGPTSFKSYWLEGESLKKAQELVKEFINEP